jgi:hypothetical protein
MSACEAHLAGRAPDGDVLELDMEATLERPRDAPRVA